MVASADIKIGVMPRTKQRRPTRVIPLAMQESEGVRLETTHTGGGVFLIESPLNRSQEGSVPQWFYCCKSDDKYFKSEPNNMLAYSFL